MSQIPLNAAASNGENNRQVTTSLPQEVVQCLENARFVRFRPPLPIPNKRAPATRITKREEREKG